MQSGRAGQAEFHEVLPAGFQEESQAGVIQSGYVEFHAARPPGVQGGTQVGEVSAYQVQNRLVVHKDIRARFLELPIWLDGKRWVFPYFGICCERCNKVGVPVRSLKELY